MPVLLHRDAILSSKVSPIAGPMTASTISPSTGSTVRRRVQQPMRMRVALPSAHPTHVPLPSPHTGRPDRGPVGRLNLSDDPRGKEDLGDNRARGPRGELNLGDANQELPRLTGSNSFLSFPRELHVQQRPSTAGDSSVASTTLTAKATACCSPPTGRNRTTMSTGSAKATTVESSAATAIVWPGAHMHRDSTIPLGPQTQQQLTLIINNMIVLTIISIRNQNKSCQNCCLNRLAVAVTAH